MSNLSAPPSAAPHSNLPPPVRARRLVYEPSLLPARRPRRRVPRWVVIPILLVLFVAVYLVLGGHHQRFVATAGTLVWASDAGSPGTPHLWRAALDGTGARRLAPAFAGAQTQPAFSSDGSQIAFVSPVNDNPQVFVMDADGQNVQQVTRNAGAKQEPRFAPGDSGLLGYVSGGAVSTVTTDGGSSSRLLPPAPDPSGAQQNSALIDSPTVLVNHFHWAPGSDAPSPALAAREETADLQALVVLPSLSGAPRDTQTDQPNSPPLAAAEAVTLGWSPSGNLLAAALLGIKGLPPGRWASAITLFDRNGDLAAGQKPLAITNTPATGPQFPVFSPDGDKVAFELWRQPDLAHAECLGLFAVPVDGSEPPRLLAHGDASQAQWAPGGQSLLFLRRRSRGGNGGKDCWQVRADGKGLARVSDGTADISAFAVSPQGRPSP